MKPQLVLAIDTSALEATVAIVRAAPLRADAEVIASSQGSVSNAHGQSLLPLVDALLEQAGVSLGELWLLAVGVGPGSFTGTRIGVATAKGLAIGSGVPLRGVDSFCALAGEVNPQSCARVVALIDARKAELYAASLAIDADDISLLAPPHHTPPAAIDVGLLAGAPDVDLDRVAFVGDGVRLLPIPIAGARPYESSPRAVTIAALAGARQLRSPIDEVDVLEPLYVRPPDITLPKNPQHNPLARPTS